MKQLSLLLLILLIGFSGFGKPVTKSEARDFVSGYLLFTNNEEYTISAIDELKTDEVITAFVVHLNPTGFLMVSANDKVEPLLAYSFESKFASPEKWPEHINWWIKNTNQKVLKKINDNSTQKNSGWELDKQLKSANVIAVAPLLNVRWDQGSRWNQFCPPDEKGPGGYTYVGCVAVSMAQAMSKYKSPTIGIGKASYVHSTYGTQTVNFLNEAPYYWDSMPATSANEHNARLLYHCAVTVNMDFGADGSGAYTQTAAGALKSYFNYSKSTKSMDRVDDDELWKSMLIENLSAGYPLIYNGDGNNGQAGHAWNIDGVDASGLFHVNWGWSGSMNGYYNINNLAPGSNDFTKNQGAIFGIKPKVQGPLDITLDKTSVREKLPAGSFVANVLVDDEFPDNPYTYHLKGNPMVIGNGYAAPKFYIENDSLKTTETFDFNKRQSYILFIEAVDTLGNSLEKMFEIMIDQAVGVPTLPEANGFKYYPNPFTSVLTIENELQSELLLYNIRGEKVYASILENGSTTMDLGHLSKGLYLIHVTNSEGTFYQKLFKQ